VEIKALIEECQGYYQEPPQNEADTCMQVILPLLYASGYEKRDIRAEMADSAGKLPDYTILPGEPPEFYVEAKAWSRSLRKQDANQALDYANHNGKRWVVLTNGCMWRLFDNLIQDVAENKLVAEMTLRDGEGTAGFLTAIGKESVLADRLEQFAKEEKAKRMAAAEADRLRFGAKANNEPLSSGQGQDSPSTVGQITDEGSFFSALKNADTEGTRLEAVGRKLVEALERNRVLEPRFTGKNLQIRVKLPGPQHTVALAHISPGSGYWPAGEVWWSMNSSLRPGTAGISETVLDVVRKANKEVLNTFARGLEPKETVCFCLLDLEGKEADFVAALGHVGENLLSDMGNPENS